MSITQTCDTLSARASEMAMKMTGFARKKVELMERIALAENVNNREAEVLQQKLASLKEEMDEWRARARSVSDLYITGNCIASLLTRSRQLTCQK